MAELLDENREQLFPMYGYIKGVLIGRYNIEDQDCEDLIGDVFVCCLRNLPDFKGNCKLKTWVYRITVRRAIDYTRKKVVRRRAHERLWTAYKFMYGDKQLTVGQAKS